MKTKLFYVVDGNEIQSYVIENDDLVNFCGFTSGSLDLYDDKLNQSLLNDYINKSGLNSDDYEIRQLIPSY